MLPGHETLPPGFLHVRLIVLPYNPEYARNKFWCFGVSGQNMWKMFNNSKQVQLPLLSLPWPVCDDAVAAALPVGGGGVAQQPDLAGVQRHQQVNHEAGVVDGLAEHGALLVLHQLLLPLLAQAGPRAQLLCRQVHGRLLLLSADCRGGGRFLERSWSLKELIWLVFFLVLATRAVTCMVTNNWIIILNK